MFIKWVCKPFKELSPGELYSILQLRSEVFVVEQNCVYQDMDDKDQGSYHFMGSIENKLVAYTRLMPAGLSYPEISIGRVVSSPSQRGKKIGRELMDESIKKIQLLFGENPIKIG